MGAGKITVDLEARSDKWSAGIDKAERGVRKFVDNAEGTLKSLSGSKGAGAFADVLAGGTKMAASLATEIRTGTSNSEAFGRIIDQIPIVGKFKQAGEAIRELVTGEQAAVIQAEKLGAAAEKVSDIYRDIASARSKFGMRGDVKESREVEIEADEKIVALHAKQEELDKKIFEIEKHRSDLIGAGIESEDNLTKSQHEELDALNREKRAYDEKILLTTQQRERGLARIRREAAERQREFMRDEEEQRAAFEEQAAAKSLKAQGKLLESRIQMAKADADQAIRAETKDKLSDAALAGLTPEDRATRIAAVGRTVAHIREKVNAEIADMQYEADRREREEARDNVEKMNEIAAAGNIERLKIEDENANALAERHGVAARSHLAERAQIEEDYQKQAFDLEKKYRTDNRTDTVNYNDPTLRAALLAADMERQQKLDLLGAKSQNEEMRRRNELLDEQRKAWERVGDAQQKYTATMADINEEFAKFHNEGLRDAARKKLDDETFMELKKLNPDHGIPTSALYGVDSAKGFTVSRDGDSIAEKQLALLQKQAQQNASFPQQMQDIWRLALKFLNGTGAPEVSIDQL